MVDAQHPRHLPVPPLPCTPGGDGHPLEGPELNIVSQNAVHHGKDRRVLGKVDKDIVPIRQVPKPPIPRRPVKHRPHPRQLIRRKGPSTTR